MKKAAALLAIFAFAVIIFSSCGAGEALWIVSLSNETKKMQFTPEGDISCIRFENLNFINEENTDITLIYSENASVDCTYSKELDEYEFEIKEDNGDLIIATEREYKFRTDDFRLTIYAPFDTVEDEGSLSVKITAGRSEKLTLKISGAAIFKVTDMDVGTFSLELAGAGDILAEGKAERANIDLSGAGNINAKKLVCSSADITLNGAGNISLSVTDKLNAIINGLGNIEYYGSPEVAKKISGLGRITEKSSESY